MDSLSDPQSYVETRYLVAKVSVDDRALNRHVLEVLRAELRALPAVRVLEIGAGLGTMLTRLLDWGVLGVGDYTALDADPRLLADLPLWLGRWASATRRALRVDGDSLHIAGAGGTAMTVRSLNDEIKELLARRADSDKFDLLIAHAFLDLVDVPAILPGLFAQLAPHGLFWFSVNFDGDTIFQPDHPLDEAIIRAYHRTMDERVRFGGPAGESRSGRHLFGHLRAAGAEVLAAGSSDWVVFAHGRQYPAGEAHFVRHILATIEAALTGQVDVDQVGLGDWLLTRRAQLDAGELAYIAHQLDFVGRRSR